MADTAPYVDNSVLVAEIARCVAAQQVSPELLALTRAAELYVPLVVTGDGDITSADSAPTLYAVENEHGVLVAAFTSTEELERADPDAGAVTVMTGGQLAAMIAESGNDDVRLAIDLAGTGVALDPSEVMTGGAHEHGPETGSDGGAGGGIGGGVLGSTALPDGPRTYLGSPAEVPDGLLDRLTVACSSKAAVISAHLLQAVTEDPTDPAREVETALLLGLVLDDDITPEQEEDVLAVVGPAIGDTAQPVDLMTLPRTAPDGEPLPGPALRQTPPFFHR